MAANPILPRAQAPITGAQPTTREWYEFFRQLLLFVGETTQTGQVIQSILDRLAALEDAEGEDGIILGIDSVTVFGTLADGVVTIRLQNDSSTPGNSYAYGTNAEGLKGWWALADAFEVATDELTKTVDPVTGITTYGLADVPDAGGGTLQKTAFDAKGRKTGTSAATTDDLPEGDTNLYFTNARADARITLQKGQPGGLATLDGAGKLDGGQLPALAITETFVVADEAAMLALTAQQGDVAVRTDIDTTYILTAEPASTLANWQELLSPTAGAVTSFNGRTGAVVPQSGDYTPAQVGAEPAFAAGTTAQYRRGDKTWRDFATDVRAAVLTGLSTATNAAIVATDTVLQAFGKLQAQINAILSTLSGVTGGTYVPTAALVSNAASATPFECYFQRINDAVEVSGAVNITATAAAGLVEFTLTLPVASNFTSPQQAVGTASFFTNSQIVPATIVAGTDDTLRVRFYAESTSTRFMSFTAMYRII